MAFPRSDESDANDASEGTMRLQDIEWLSSLSEAEIDFLISLKEMAIRRAKNAGHKDLGDKFDLRMLRALGFILFEFFKERVQNTDEIPNSAEIMRSLNRCGLSFLDSDRKSECSSSILGTNDLSFVTPRKKRLWDGLCEGTETSKRYKRRKAVDADK